MNCREKRTSLETPYLLLFTEWRWDSSGGVWIPTLLARYFLFFTYKNQSFVAEHLVFHRTRVCWAQKRYLRLETFASKVGKLTSFTKCLIGGEKIREGASLRYFYSYFTTSTKYFIFTYYLSSLSIRCICLYLSISSACALFTCSPGTFKTPKCIRASAPPTCKAFASMAFPASTNNG